MSHRLPCRSTPLALAACVAVVLACNPGMDAPPPPRQASDNANTDATPSTKNAAPLVGRTLAGFEYERWLKSALENIDDDAAMRFQYDSTLDEHRRRAWAGRASREELVEVEARVCAEAFGAARGTRPLAILRCVEVLAGHHDMLWKLEADEAFVMQLVKRGRKLEHFLSIAVAIGLCPRIGPALLNMFDEASETLAREGPLGRAMMYDFWRFQTTALSAPEFARAWVNHIQSILNEAPDVSGDGNAQSDNAPPARLLDAHSPTGGADDNAPDAEESDDADEPMSPALARMGLATLVLVLFDIFPENTEARERWTALAERLSLFRGPVTEQSFVEYLAALDAGTLIVEYAVVGDPRRNARDTWPPVRLVHEFGD